MTFVCEAVNTVAYVVWFSTSNKSLHIYLYIYNISLLLIIMIINYLHLFFLINFYFLK